MDLDEAMLDPAVYDHLRELAGRIHRERGGPGTLQPTALMHEAWIKVQRSGGSFTDRRHFVAVACKAMRQILIDHARKRWADKRDGGVRTTIEGLALAPGRAEAVDLLALDDALTALNDAQPRAAEIAQLRVFGGLTVPEIAELLGVGTSTVDRTWRAARAFLAVRLEG